jgi:sulfide:quinone oxidoreductase
LPTDAFGRVTGAADVYAAGDASSFPIKQGGLASQQADAVASTIAAWAGAAVQPTPFRPVLRGQLLTAGASRYLELDLGTSHPKTTLGQAPPRRTVGKIASEYLTPFLAKRGMGQPSADPPPIQE